MGKAWPIIMRTENLGKDIYEDEIWIKLARDTNLEQMFSGGYYRTADYEKGGEWKVCTYFFQFTGKYFTEHFLQLIYSPQSRYRVVGELDLPICLFFSVPMTFYGTSL